MTLCKSLILTVLVHVGVNLFYVPQKSKMAVSDSVVQSVLHHYRALCCGGHWNELQYLIGHDIQQIKK